MDRLYVDRSGGRFEGWTYSDGRRYPVGNWPTLTAARAYARRHHYALIRVLS